MAMLSLARRAEGTGSWLDVRASTRVEGRWDDPWYCVVRHLRARAPQEEVLATRAAKATARTCYSWAISLRTAAAASRRRSGVFLRRASALLERGQLKVLDDARRSTVVLAEPLLERPGRR